MKTTSVLVLAVLAAAVVIVAIVASRGERPATPADAPAANKPLVFETLKPALASASTITIKHGDKQFSLKKNGPTWEISDKGGYPAKTEDVQKTLFQLGELRLAEEMTSKPDRYAQLSVQDPDGKPIKEGESGPTLLTVQDDKGQTLASLILGNSRPSTKPGVYIRRAGQAQSWLTDGALDVATDPVRWIDAAVVNIPRERIKGATSTAADGSTVRVSRAKPEDPSFTVADLPAGKELKYQGAGDQLPTAIGGLQVEDVAPADQIDFEGKNGGHPAGYCEFRTFDGLMIAAQLVEKDGKTWGRFSAYSEAAPAAAAGATGATGASGATAATGPAGATGAQPAASGATGASGASAAAETKPGQKTPADVQKEADELNAKLGKWAFVIPAWKLTAFQTKMSDLIKTDEPPKPPPSLEGTTPLIPPQPK